jgi:hypothetical protein
MLLDIVSAFFDCEHRLERTSLDSGDRIQPAAFADVIDQITTRLLMALVTEPYLMHPALSTSDLL